MQNNDLASQDAFHALSMLSVRDAVLTTSRDALGEHLGDFRTADRLAREEATWAASVFNSQERSSNSTFRV